MRVLLLALVAFGLACSADHGNRLRVGDEAGHPGGGGAGFGPAQVLDGGSGSGNEALSVRVQDVDEVVIEVITLACAGDCADVEAIAGGVNPPYVFQWEGGSKNPSRRVCLDASANFG